ncbi:MAG: hypothetical protein DRJ47_01270 [Thermoprotei archaeon]|nr:MAG: hypothetical protein DRJ47_01270 [Thermoprotei archaeon]
MVVKVQVGEKKLFLIIVVVSLILFTVVVVKETRVLNGFLQVPTYHYNIEVLDNGSALVTITFDAKGPGQSYVYLPRFTNYSLNIEGDVSTSVEEDPNIYFYHKRIFYYNSSDAIHIEVFYVFPYASLMIGDEGWFMSPLIYFSENSVSEIKVTLPHLKYIIKSQPSPISQDKDSNTLYFRMGWNDIYFYGYRVAINYRLENPIENTPIVRYISGGSIELVFRVPAIYEEIVDKMTVTLDGAQPFFRDLFNFFPDSLEFEFYLPELQDLSTLGYVESEIISLGKVHINLALLRFKPGYLEHTVIHEVVHVMLGKIGVAAKKDTRWIHEGLAEYISIQIEKLMGMNTTETEISLEERAKSFREKYRLGNLIYWSYGSDQDLYYGASYYVMKVLGEKYGGLDFYRRLFQAIKNGKGVNSTNDFIDAVASVAGGDAYNLFSSWGFPVKKALNPLLIYSLMIAIVIVAVVVVMVYLNVRKGKEEGLRCPYCGAPLDPISRFCIYCGREIEETFGTSMPGILHEEGEDEEND